MHSVRSLLSYFHKSIVQNVIRNSHLERYSFYSTAIEDSSDEIVKKLCGEDQVLEKKLRILMLEVEVMRQDGRLAPDHLKLEQWQHLLGLQSKNQRSTYLTYLWKNERRRENVQAKKEAKRKEYETSPPEVKKEFDDDLLYGIQYQSLFLRIRDASINNFDNFRALQAMTYGQSTVIDCSYEKHMVTREIINAAKQMTYVFGDNRIHREPFNLHLCNVDLDGLFMKQLRKNIPNLDEPWFPLNIHSQSYLDLFPKDNLVYLTPHCREELTSFDPDAIYIVGCMVDKMNNEPLSLAKAKRDGLRMAKLPLDRYLEWAPGAKKNLNINHMIPILLDLRATGDWEYSLRHIPRRKLMETKVMAMQSRLKKGKITKDELVKNLSAFGKHRAIPFNDKRSKAKKSLYDDDNI